MQRRDDGHGLRQPDLTIWFDLDPAVAAMRLANARTPDRFESLPVDFFARVAQGYHQRLLADSGRFARIEADQPVTDVWSSVLSVLVSRGWLTASCQP